MFKLPHNCIYFICYQGNAQNPPSQASTVHDLRTSRCKSWIQKRQRNQGSNCQHLLDHRKTKRIPEKMSTSVSLITQKPLTVWITTNCGKFLRDGISDHITCLLRNLCVGQEATVRDLHRPTGSKLGKKYDKAYVITMII